MTAKLCQGLDADAKVKCPDSKCVNILFSDFITDFVILIALESKASAFAVNFKNLFMFYFGVCIHALTSWNICVEVNASKLSGHLPFVELTCVRVTY